MIFLDLSAEQLADNAAAPVSNVLYWKVLQWAGFSTEKKLARLEFTLDRMGKYDEFRSLYQKEHGQPWEEIHNDPLLGVARAAESVSQIIPKEFPTPKSFRELRFEEAKDLRNLTQEIIDLCRRHSGKENLLFLIDEAGQYVAPRGDLILNLDGFARNIKELGKGKVWVIATGQQTLAEIVDKAAHNSTALNKLKDRFPISIHLDASDIREVTYRRLLTKSEDGDKKLRELFAANGQALATHTRLSETTLFKGDPDIDVFAKLYPFLPQHFELLLDLIRTLARSTGGIGLRSAIRVLQDVLVDKSRSLPRETTKLADRPVGSLACVDYFYDTLRADIAKVLPHVTAGVDKVMEAFPKNKLAARVAKAVAALQPLENFPRSTENIAALLYPELGAPSLFDGVRDALREIAKAKECGLIEDPQAGGYVFLSDAVKPLREKRSGYVVTSGERSRILTETLKEGTPDYPLFSNQPSAQLDNVKQVRAAVRLERGYVVGSSEDIQIRIELVDPSLWDEKRTDLLTETNTAAELKNTIVWLAKDDDVLADSVTEIVRSDKIVSDIDERQADSDVAQFLRSERRAADKYRELVGKTLAKTLMAGTMILRGKPTPSGEAGATLEAAVRTVLGSAAKEVFKHHHLVPHRFSTDTAAKLLGIDRLDRVPNDLNPMKLIGTKGGSPRVDVNHAALAEVLRVFREKAADSGTNRLHGKSLQDIFSAAPYGWSKDAVRYLFAMLLIAGEVEYHVPGGDAPVRTAGPQALEAVKSTNSFNRVGISPRDSRPPIEAMDRASRRLMDLFGDEVLPLEDHISRAVRKHVPGVLEKIGSLPDRIRLLELKGEDRAKQVLANSADLLKGDASGAAAVLGGTDCELPDDIRWAREVVDALESGGETEIQNTRTLLATHTELTNLFPSTAADLLADNERETIDDVFASDRFHERLTDLRGVVRSLKDRAKDTYRDEYAGYEADLQAALNVLESAPYWLKISEQDREEIVGKLQADVPTEPDEENPLRSLQTLLVRRSMLAGRREELLEEIRRRVPGEEDTGGDGDGGEEMTEETLTASQLVTAAVIETHADLDTWLGSLRTKIANLLKQRKRVRIKGDE